MKKPYIKPKLSVDTGKPSNNVPANKKSHSKIWVISLCIAMLSGIIAMVVVRNTMKSTPQDSDGYHINVDVAADVVERGLVSSSLNASDVVSHGGDVSLRNQSRHSFTKLAFVTPWNKAGYDAAVRNARHFSIISPVWLQLKPQGLVTGLQDHDATWISTLRQYNNDIKVMPRVLIEGWAPELLQRLFVVQSKSIVDEYGYDGYVMEVLNPIYDHIVSSWSGVVHLLRTMDKMMKERTGRSNIVLVLPPFDFITEKMIDEIEPYVHHFMMMSYDYSSPNLPGPLAPLEWTGSVIKRLGSRTIHKMLIGIPFYGRDYIKGALSDVVVGPKYYDILKSNDNMRIIYDKKHVEHVHQYTSANGQQHLMYYPSLMFINKRLELASSLGAGGIGIWEIGQGLEYFFDLL